MTSTTIFNLALLTSLIFLVFYHFVYKSILQLIAIRHIKKNGKKALATVVETRKMKGRDGTTFFHAVFEYTTNTGRTITTQLRYANGIRPQVGKELTLYYLPSAPDKCYVPNPVPFEIILILFAIPGLIFCLVELLKIAYFI